MGFLLCRFILLTPVFPARRSGSFPEQSNKMNERSVTGRQTNNAVYIYNSNFAPFKQAINLENTVLRS